MVDQVKLYRNGCKICGIGAVDWFLSRTDPGPISLSLVKPRETGDFHDGCVLAGAWRG